MAFSRKRVPEKLSEEELFDKAVRALARRSRSTAELRRLLQPFASQGADLDNILARLREYGYLDEKRFAESFARLQKEDAAHGPRRVERDLRRRGVASALAGKVVNDTFAGEDEIQLARQWLRRKRITPPQDLRSTARVHRSLLQAGFSGNAALQALKQWKLDAEWMEALAGVEPETEEEPPQS